MPWALPGGRVSENRFPVNIGVLSLFCKTRAPLASTFWTMPRPSRGRTGDDPGGGGARLRSSLRPPHVPSPDPVRSDLTGGDRPWKTAACGRLGPGR